MSPKFEVYPAIDLRDGQVVRLAQGDPGRQTAYSSLPREVAARWIEAGASWLHLVNLDGAFDDPRDITREAIKAVVAACRKMNPEVQVQLGGGLRTFEDISVALGLGISRVILGTAAVDNPNLVASCLDQFGPSQIVVGIDVRDGLVATHGWQRNSQLSPLKLARDLKQMGLKTVIFTAIRRDGMGTGPDLAFAGDLARKSGLEIILAGGVHSLEDVKAARAAGLGGLVIGRALYEGQIDLKEAIAC